MNALIVGCGYLGQQVARLWNAQGACVYAITRSEAKAELLARQSIQPIVVDWYQPREWPGLPRIDRLLISVSHASIPQLSPSQTHVAGLVNLFQHLVAMPDRVAYLSTTGVYAACDDGRWIDEGSAVCPDRPGAVAALAAEQWLAERVPAERMAILRAAGIYGPGRIPSLDKLRAGEPIAADPNSFLNLIHVEDLAELAIELMTRPSASGVYNVSDGQPVLRRDYYQFIAKTILAPAPTFIEPTAVDRTAQPTSQRRRGEGNKRIANDRLREALHCRLRFPNYVEGLGPLLPSPSAADRKSPANSPEFRAAQ